MSLSWIYRFSENEIAAMRAEEALPDGRAVERYHLCFALGKAYEDRKNFEESWKFYDCGNRLKRAEDRYSPEITEADARRQMEVCTRQFFAARAGVGARDPDPIFIVGMPRSGSTLIEQILASHSQVEATHELGEIQRMAAEWRGSRSYPEDVRYPAVLTELSAEEFRRLGERYLMETRAYRSGKRFFVDKMPNNFRDIGLIHLMLPNSKIIDVRPILEFCGLEFEPRCLDFYTTQRGVHSASSEQVRQPIFREGLFQWRNYESFLGPLKAALSDALGESQGAGSLQPSPSTAPPRVRL